MWCDNNLIFLLGCTQRAVRASLLAKLQPLGIGYEHFQTLVGLSVGDDIAQNVLASRLCLEPTFTTRMLRRAERDGLVIRVRDETDTRVVRVRMTPKGRELWQRLEAVHAEFEAQALACLNPDEQEQLRRLLMAVRDHARPPLTCSQ